MSGVTNVSIVGYGDGYYSLPIVQPESQDGML